jgi:cytochrome P450
LIYDPYSRAFQEDPYPLYRHFRDAEPCAYNAKMDFYALFRFEDVWQATLDWETYSSSLGPSLENRGQFPGELMSIIGMDPPRHVRLRNLVSKGFTPRRIAALEPEIRRIAARYLDPVRGDGRELDFQAVLSNLLPMDVISALLGIPEADRDRYRTWVDRGLERDPDTGQIPPEGIEGMQKAGQMMRALLAERRARPQDDLMSLLAEASYEDVDGRTKRLTDDEAVAFMGLLAAAGAETTTKLLGNCVVYLARHPDQRKRLWDDPSLLPKAIEEVLRYDAPSQFQGRVALREVKVHGVTIPERARVALVTGAACRDEREFPDPERFDIARRPERQLYFGHGNHVCIGKSLARLEARVVLEEIRERFPRYQVDESGLRRTYQAHVRGFKSVPIRTS